MQAKSVLFINNSKLTYHTKNIILVIKILKLDILL